MKFFVDLFPVIIFFVVYKFADDPHTGIINATIAAIIAGILQISYVYATEKKLQKMHLITLALLIVLGSLTIALDDERFIKWKPTAVNLAFALAFLISQFVSRRNLVQRMLDHTLSASDAVWARLNLAWVSFFVVVAVLNVYVAHNFSTDTWVDFKLFGVLGLTFVFMILQGLYLMRNAEPIEADEGDDNDRDSSSTE